MLPVIIPELTIEHKLLLKSLEQKIHKLYENCHHEIKRSILSISLDSDIPVMYPTPDPQALLIKKEGENLVLSLI